MLTPRISSKSHGYSSSGLEPSLNDTHQPVEAETDQTDGDNGEENVGVDEAVIFLPQAAQELGEHFRSHDNQPGEAEGEAISGENIGKVAGMMMRLSVFIRESLSTRPTLRYSGLILRTPTAVLITVGHMAQVAMVKIAAGSDCLKITNPNGNHAKGDMGRKIWITGSKVR